MKSQEAAAVIAAVVLILLLCFQILLAAGLPLGRAAWGGRHRILPAELRLASLAAAVILGAAVWIILARAGLAAPGAGPKAVRAAVWVFSAYWAFNTFGNIVSKSPWEKYIMTSAALCLLVCFIIVALS